MKILLFAFIFFINMSANAQIVRFVAPNGIGTADGLTNVNAADFLSDTFWLQIQNLLLTQAVTVKFNAGNYTRAYTEKSLKLNGMGHAKNNLVLEGESGNTIFTADTGGVVTKSTMISIINSQNITVKNFYFTGNGPINYVLQVSSSMAGTVTRNILIENCHWEDMRGIRYGASGNSQYTTSYVTYKNCSFKRIGLNGASHVIYNAYDAHHISIIDCHFEDCTGDYIRFRDNLDYAVVKGSTFIRNPGFTDAPFIAVPQINDVDPGDEIFPTHYSFTNNTFTNVKTAIIFRHTGYSPAGWNYLLTAAEGAILTGGTLQQKKDLLLNNFNLNTDLIRISNNTYDQITNQVTLGVVLGNYGAVSKGWLGEAVISDLFNNSSNLLPWEEDYHNLNPGVWSGDSRSVYYNLASGTGNAGKVFSSGSSTSRDGIPGFLPFVPASDGGGYAKVSIAGGGVFTLQDTIPNEASLKINASANGNPTKLMLYKIGDASPVTSLFFTIKFDAGTATQGVWTCAMGNYTSGTNFFNSNSALPFGLSSTSPEVFSTFRWEIARENPQVIKFQYRPKSENNNTPPQTVNTTTFYRGGEFAMEIYCNNDSVSKSYMRGGVIYELPLQNYHIWTNGERILNGNIYEFPANHLDLGSHINSFLMQGTLSSSTPLPAPVVGDNSAVLTIGKIKMGFANDTIPPDSLISFDVKAPDWKTAITEFKGSKTSFGNLLSWQTLSEKNNQYFELEKSSDGKSFSPIKRITGAGTSTEKLSYSWLDTNPLAGVNYYRLKQVDVDGLFFYLEEVITLNKQLEADGLKLYPNPGFGIVNIQLPVASVDAEINVYSQVGKLVETSTNVSGNNLAVDISKQPTGIYFIQVLVKGKSRILKYIKQ